MPIGMKRSSRKSGWRGADGELDGELVDTAKRLVTLPPLEKLTADEIERQMKLLNAVGLTSVRVPVAGGTDSPVIPYSPWWAMYHFVTRDTISDGVYGASEAISREDALRLFTINAARLMGDEGIKGSIEPGKYADLVVLPADPLTVAPKQLEAMKPVATMVGGRFVYRFGLPDAQTGHRAASRWRGWASRPATGA